MNWGALVRRPPPRLLASGVLALSLAATVTWGYITNRDLEQTRADLAAARDTIDDQSSQLAGLRGDLEEEEAGAAELRSTVTDLQTTVDELRSSVASSEACASSLAQNVTDLGDILDRQVTLNNLTAEGSIWARASDANTALTNQSDEAWYNAYSAAFDGDYAGANYWVDQAQARIAEANSQVDIMNAEIDKGNAEIDAIDVALAELATETGASADACQTVGADR